MSSDFAGFNFLQAAMHPMSDIRRGYGPDGAAVPDIRRGYGPDGAAMPDIRRGYGPDGAAMPDTTQHTTNTYMALPQS